MSIVKKSNQLLLTIPTYIYRTLFARIRPTEFDIQVDVKTIIMSF